MEPCCGSVTTGRCSRDGLGTPGAWRHEGSMTAPTYSPRNASLAPSQAPRAGGSLTVPSHDATRSDDSSAVSQPLLQRGDIGFDGVRPLGKAPTARPPHALPRQDGRLSPALRPRRGEGSSSQCASPRRAGLQRASWQGPERGTDSILRSVMLLEEHYRTSGASPGREHLQPLAAKVRGLLGGMKYCKEGSPGDSSQGGTLVVIRIGLTQILDQAIDAAKAEEFLRAEGAFSNGPHASLQPHLSDDPFAGCEDIAREDLVDWLQDFVDGMSVGSAGSSLSLAAPSTPKSAAPKGEVRSATQPGEKALALDNSDGHSTCYLGLVLRADPCNGSVPPDSSTPTAFADRVLSDPGASRAQVVPPCVTKAAAPALTRVSDVARQSQLTPRLLHPRAAPRDELAVATGDGTGSARGPMRVQAYHSQPVQNPQHPNLAFTPEARAVQSRSVLVDALAPSLEHTVTRPRGGSCSGHAGEPIVKPAGSAGFVGGTDPACQSAGPGSNLGRDVLTRLYFLRNCSDRQLFEEATLARTQSTRQLLLPCLAPIDKAAAGSSRASLETASTAASSGSEHSLLSADGPSESAMLCSSDLADLATLRPSPEPCTALDGPLRSWVPPMDGGSLESPLNTWPFPFLRALMPG